MQENFLSNPFLYSLALTLIHFIWQGLLIAAALKLALIFTSHKKSQLRYAYTSLAMLANLSLPFITFFILYKPEYLQLTNQLPLVPFVDADYFNHNVESDFWLSSFAEHLPSLAMAWIFVVCILSFKLLFELYSVNQLPKIGIIKADDNLIARFKVLVAQINLSSTPKLIISLKTDVPMAIGWLKPVVLIPFSMLTGLTPAQLDMLILHELAHIRRHDYLVNFIQTLVEILLFFHPAVVWVSNQMRNEREYCTDDVAVQHCGSAIAYAHTLADTATLCNKHHSHSIPTMAMAASGGDLKQRVVRLVNQQHHCTNENDVSKWLASVTIILTIVFASSKQFLSLPYVDFSSGSISLYKSVNEIMLDNSADTRTLNLPENSFALKLLEESGNQEKINDKPISTNTIKLMQKEKEIALVKKPASLVNIAKAHNVIHSFKENSPEVAEPPLATIANNKIESSTNFNLPVEEQSSQLNSVTQSISELAFERTDSTKKQSSMTNPYAGQVALLINEPALESNHNVIKKSTINKLQTTLPSKKIISTNTAVKAIEKAPIVVKKVSAELISSIEPKYPSTAKRKGIELEVKVDFIIDKNGQVKDLTFTNKGKVSYFRSAIRAAIEQWRFLPARIGDKAVDSNMTKIFSFSLLK